MTASPPANPDDPEADGFGKNRKRIHIEWLLIALVVIGAPLGLIFGARAAARGVAHRLPVSVDEKLGLPTWQAMNMAGNACKYPEPQRYVEKLAQPLVAALGSEFRFQFLVVSSTDVNAFALPGGYVVVNQGLLDTAKSGEEVAAVLAHELHHVTLRHGTERVVTQLGTFALLSFFFVGGDLQTPAFTLAELSSLAYNREQEADADAAAIALLKRAGISPRGMGTFFERIGESLTPPEVLSTHPDPGNRAANAREAAAGFTPTVTLPAPTGLACE